MGPTSMSPEEIGKKKRNNLSLPPLQTVTRKGSFDAGHRVMNERVKCFNLHGHTYLYELEFSFDSMKAIGYAIDFKEIKRVGCEWIEDNLDHAMLLNPDDRHISLACHATGSKTWYMSLNGIGKYCNPTVENIVKEMYIALDYLFSDNNLKLSKIRLYETPNCFTDCTIESISLEEKENFLSRHLKDLQKYKQEKGTIEYDDRNIRS